MDSRDGDWMLAQLRAAAAPDRQPPIDPHPRPEPQDVVWLPPPRVRIVWLAIAAAALWLAAAALWAALLDGADILPTFPIPNWL